MFIKLGGVHGLFGAFFRCVGSGGFTVQAAMLLLAHSVGRMGYLQRCLPPAALMEAAQRWDGLMVESDTAQRVLDLATLMTAATHSLYNARLSEVKRAGDLRGQARLCGGRAPYASRWQTVRPTEEAYQLADEYYRYAARRDLGLPPARDVTLPRLCNACGVSVAADGRHGQRCIYNSSYTKLRHDSIHRLAQHYPPCRR